MIGLDDKAIEATVAVADIVVEAVPINLAVY